MAVLHGLDNQTSITFDDIITSTPEFYTNVHTKIFDDTQYNYDGTEFNKLVSSTSINWQGAYMPNTARYLNLDNIYLRNTSELLDIIERIALKIKNGKKVSDLILKKVNAITVSNSCKISVTANVSGNVTFSIPPGTTIESISLTVTDNTVHVDKDVEYEFIITNNTSNNIDEIDGLITALLNPDDEEYSECTRSINVAITGIYIMDIYWSNTDDIVMEIGETIIWPKVMVEKSNDTSEELSVGPDVTLAGGFNPNSVGIYNVRAKYNNIYTSNVIKVTVKDTRNEITEIRILGENNVVLEDTSIPVPVTYTVKTFNIYGDVINDITNLVTLETIGEISHTVSGNVITYMQEGSLIIKTSYTINGKTIESDEFNVLVTREKKYLFGIALNTSDNYINPNNYNAMQGVINPVSNITEGEYKVYPNAQYLYIVIPVGYSVKVMQSNSSFVINMFTHNGTRFVRNTDATIENGTYKIYRSATLLYSDENTYGSIIITKES